MFKIEKAVVRSRNGKQYDFEVPKECIDASLYWKAEERNGTLAYYVDGSCRGGFDGTAAITLVPHIDNRFVKFMAVNNHNEYWCLPVFGNDLASIDENVRLQSLLINEDGRYTYFLPVCDDTYKTLIVGGCNAFVFRTFTNCDFLDRCNRQLAFVYGEGEDPYELMHRCAKTAAELLGNGLLMREDRQVPDVFDYLGWCSWDALQIRVSHDKLLEKAKEFREKNIPVHYAVIDDMWADCPALNEVPDGTPFGQMVRQMHKAKMRSFEGDPIRFPKGMKAAIDDLKAAGIPKVGVWFPTTGYWFGYTEDGEAEKLRALLDYSSGGRLIVKPEHNAAAEYFETLCRKAHSFGADLVKIDNQAFHRTNYSNISPIGSSSRIMQRAIDSAAEENFDSALINCMGMTNECMFNRPTSAVCRCSDDFIPENRAWFAKNVLECAYSGTLQGQYYVNDWDMWWTDDGQARKNSLCRAVSGGPIYISDKIGRTIPEILAPLMLSDGRILRPDMSAMPTADCLTEDPTTSRKVFKIRNQVGNCGIIAAFNIDVENRSVFGTVSAKDSGLADCTYAYYEYFSGDFGILPSGESLSIALNGNDEFKLYTLVPYSCGQAAILGRIDKFVGIKAVTHSDSTSFGLLEGGKVGVISDSDIRFYANGNALTAERNGMLYTLDCDADVNEICFNF